MEKTITYLDPAELHVHPDAKGLHSLADDDPRFIALVESMRLSGFDPDKPLTVDSTKRVLDGRHRLRAAKRLQLERVPCVVRNEAESATIILNSTIARKHFTKGALAYDVYPLFEKAHREAAARQTENLKKGLIFPSPIQSATGRKRVEDFARLLGISTDLFQQAAKVHEIFEKDAAYKAAMEPRIFAEPVGGEHEDRRPVGLGAVIAGWGGQKATKSQPKVQTEQLELFEEGFVVLRKRFTYWQKFSDQEKAALRPVIRQVVEDMPEDLRAELAKALKAVGN